MNKEKGLFAGKVAEKKTAGIYMPEVCDVEGCGCSVHSLITVVRNQHDRVVTGSFSQFGLTTKPLKVDSRFTFMRFIARCADCLTNDMARAGVVESEVKTDHMENFQEAVF